MSIHGDSATDWMFCACWSITPHDTAGGRSPRPRKLSEVSATIMSGSASVVAAMMWLVKSGSMCLKITRRGRAPTSSAAVTKSSLRTWRKRPRTTRASSVHPISDTISVMKK